MSASLTCSMCGKPNSDDILVLIAGVSGCICDECVDLCGIIVADKRATAPSLWESAIRQIVREEIDADRVWRAAYSSDKPLAELREREAGWRREAIRMGRREDLDHG